MRPRHSARYGHRRDGGVRQIRSDGGVHYPGVDLPADVAAETGGATPDSAIDDGRRLSPARDTGLEISSRVSRQQDSAARRQRTTVIVSIVAVAVLISAAIGWRYVSDRMAAASPLTAETASGKVVGNIAQTLSGHGSTTSASVHAAATPIFAYYGKLKLHLPIPLADLTEIGFHQASYGYALRMKTTMKDANLALAAKNKSTGRNISKQPSGPDAVMTGYVIRMWRNRPGRPDTAADVGALAGTTVLAPVNGTVIKIKPYLLYGKYPDYELHIHPDGTSGLDLVMIHLTNLTAHVGDHVDAGVTPLARVRKLSDKFHDQLADYTVGGGDHVHIQVNNIYYKGYKGLIGAITVPRSPGVASTTGGTSTPVGASSGSDDSGSDDSANGD
ncbi:MAG: hypothetical protein P4L93_03375 [Coriobacteriia bacterium]|nr:hypothetical protein [Coriobacteriia bacterium]